MKKPRLINILSNSVCFGWNGRNYLLLLIGWNKHPSQIYVGISVQFGRNTRLGFKFGHFEQAKIPHWTNEGENFFLSFFLFLFWVGSWPIYPSLRLSMHDLGLFHSKVRAFSSLRAIRRKQFTSYSCLFFYYTWPWIFIYSARRYNILRCWLGRVN